MKELTEKKSNSPAELSKSKALSNLNFSRISNQPEKKLITQVENEISPSKGTTPNLNRNGTPFTFANASGKQHSSSFERSPDKNVLQPPSSSSGMNSEEAEAIVEKEDIISKISSLTPPKESLALKSQVSKASLAQKSLGDLSDQRKRSPISAKSKSQSQRTLRPAEAATSIHPIYKVEHNQPNGSESVLSISQKSKPEISPSGLSIYSNNQKT